jgi:hypothetical protein
MSLLGRSQPTLRPSRNGAKEGGCAAVVHQADSTRRRDVDPRIGSLSGTQIHPSCGSGVFVDQSAESVAAVELVRRTSTDGA